MPIIVAMEIAAAEIAAAAAAEAAAVAAAEAAAATAAEVAATEATTATAAQAATAATQQAAAQQAAQAGIMEVGGTTANTAASLTTPEAVQAAAQQAGQNITPEVANAGIESVPEVMSDAQRAYLEASTASLNSGPVPGQVISQYPSTFTPGDISNEAMRAGIDPNIPSNVTNEMMSAGTNPSIPSGVTNDMLRTGFTPPPFMDAVPPGAPPPGSDMTAQQTLDMIAKNNQAGEGPISALERGMNTAVEYAKAHKYTTMMGATLGAKALGLFNPSSGGGFGQKEYDGPLSRYKLSPDFRGSTVNPANFQYTPRYAEGGGIMGPGSYNIPVGYDNSGDIPQYAKGGSLSSSIEQYQKMLAGTPQAAPTTRPDVGIFYDTDPDTRYQDALTAAQIRQSKINQRAYVSPPVAKRPTPMGQLQMASVKPKKQSSADDVEAAQGGIMHASLGGYAAGGNPRLLKGPGDGMSDNIPATINGRQPARLANGEFVIPADVVSHLGNGSTEAGAKQLHAMMDKVRSARTGNSKQGKQINPKKYMPK